MNDNNVGARIKKRRKELGLSAEAVAQQVGISPATMYRYEKNEIMNMGTDKLAPIAAVLGTTPAFLMGWTGDANDALNRPKLPDNVYPVNNVHRIPMIGSVAAGEPIIAEQEYETYVPGPLKADFALTVSGDSMSPTFMDGDVVYLKQMDDVSDGQIAAVITDDEARLKRVYHIPDGLNLVSDNPLYPPVTVTIADYNSIRILGLVIGYTRMF